MPIDPMPLFVPMNERNAGDVCPSSDAMRTSSSIVTKAAVRFGNGEAEQADFAHRVDEIGGNGVGFVNFGFARHERLAHEAADRVFEQGLRFSVADHRFLLAIFVSRTIVP